MKNLILALSLFIGGEPCLADTPVESYLVCALQQDADRIASISSVYNATPVIAELIRYRRCVVAQLDARSGTEYRTFGIGSNLYRFEIWEMEGYDFYVLIELGEGYVA